MIKTIPISRTARHFILILAFILTIFLRFYKLEQLPPGFTFDEASHALDAVDILHGHFTLISPRLQQAPMGYMYLLAGMFAMFGKEVWVQRALTATFGCLLIGVNFRAMRQLFASQPLVALFSSLLLATSLWAIHASRIGYEYILTPCLALVALELFCRSNSRYILLKLLGAAGCIGLSFYLYEGSAPMLLVIPVTFMFRYARARWAGETVALQGRNVALVTGVSWLIALPLLWFFFSGTTPEVTRTANKVIFNSETGWIDSFTLLKLSLWTHGGVFLGYSGSGSWLSGLPDQPLLSPLLAICFVMGLLISLWRHQAWPYLLLLVYWVGMVAPSILTFEDAPHYFRLLGAMPATYAFIALAWAEIYGYLRARLGQFKQAEWLAFAPFLLWGVIWLPYQAYQSYFVIWAQQPEVAAVFDRPSIELVQLMSKENDPQVIYLLPREAGNLRHNYVLDFLYRGQTKFDYLPVSKPQIQATLTKMTAGYQTVHFIRHLSGAREDKHEDAVFDTVSFLLAKQGQLVHVSKNDNYEVQSYRLESDQVDFTATATQLPSDLEPTDLMMGNSVKIVGFRYQIEPKQAIVTLAWQGLNQVIMDYTISVQLLDSQRQRVAGVDVIQKRGMVSLDGAEILRADYVIPLTEVAPGEYTVAVVIYYFDAAKKAVPVGQLELPTPLSVK